MGPFKRGNLGAGYRLTYRNATPRPARRGRSRARSRISISKQKGWFGAKTAKGYYLYEGDTPVAQSRYCALAIVEAPNRRLNAGI